jgi:protein-arginine kinase activator protein McsA
VVQIVGEEYDEVYSWEALSENLRQEEGLPNPQRDVTVVVQAAVQRMGLTWQECSNSRKRVCSSCYRSASNLASALSRIESMDIPEDLANTWGILR